MKRPCTLLVLGIFLLATEARAEDKWWGPDKALHLGVGAAIGAVCYGGLWAADVSTPGVRFPVSIAVGMVPALGKEIYDATRPDNYFSGRDLLWSAIGIVGGAAILFAIDLLTRRDDDASPGEHTTEHLHGPVQGLFVYY